MNFSRLDATFPVIQVIPGTVGLAFCTDRGRGTVLRDTNGSSGLAGGQQPHKVAGLPPMQSAHTLVECGKFDQSNPRYSGSLFKSHPCILPILS